MFFFFLYIALFLSFFLKFSHGKYFNTVNVSTFLLSRNVFYQYITHTRTNESMNAVFDNDQTLKCSEPDVAPVMCIYVSNTNSWGK